MILIDVDLPKKPDEMIELIIFGDGKVIQTGESWRSPENGKCYYTTTTPEKFFNAVPVQKHGRLIDEKDICDKIRPLIENPYCYNRLQVISETLGKCLQIIRDAPTIIPASEESE